MNVDNLVQMTYGIYAKNLTCTSCRYINSEVKLIECKVRTYLDDPCIILKFKCKKCKKLIEIDEYEIDTKEDH